MRGCAGIGALVLLLVVTAGCLWADPIPGSINELNNGNFDNPAGEWGLWQHGSGMALAVDGVDHGWTAYCKSAGSDDLWLRQVVDETLNPLWNPAGHQKMIDLMADIRPTWALGDPGHPALDSAGNTVSRVKFGLDWWDEEYNGVSDPSQLPPAQHYAWSGWYYFNAGENGQWRTVNPWDDDLWVLSVDGRPIQPRWVSVEIVIEQAGGEFVWVDNVVLTSACVPEPSSLLALGSGILALCGRLRKRK